MANLNATDGMYKESDVPAIFNFSDSNIWENRFMENNRCSREMFLEYTVWNVRSQSKNQRTLRQYGEVCEGFLGRITYIIEIVLICGTDHVRKVLSPTCESHR
jgi:hypothetical protein